MHYSSVLLTIAPLASALVLPGSTPSCTSFAQSLQLSEYNAAYLNATQYAVRSVNGYGVYNAIPFCEVYASISYGTNNTLVFATWLPTRRAYEDHFMAVGNGGMAGIIDYGGMITQLNAGMGFAVVGGNAGHLASENNDGGAAPGVYIPYLHDKEQVTAWIHDAISLYTPAAKALVAAYYGHEARHAYYDGCSTGGAQGFTLAQYHPQLFDGIFAGSPGNWYSHLALSFLWNAQATATNASKLSQDTINFITNATLDACDLNDGVADRLIENPLSCDFTIDRLACNASAANSSACLSPAQLAAAKAIYAGPLRPDNGTQLYPGFDIGSESYWLYQEDFLSTAFSVPILHNLVYGNLSYDASNFDWASNVADLDAKAGTLIDEISPDPSAFKDRGGKLLVTQGWADAYNAATWPIQHLEQVADFFDGSVAEWFRLFMVPGGVHCGAAAAYGNVPATYHTVAKMVQWVEGGDAAEEVLSTSSPDGSNRTRKLCPWPATARYVSGDVDD
ncbi:hypothetical protein B0A48_08809 [Cryoendolithus antarcticus]|uniref:Carboxylic ester hydrolase n=1 Tax=Cryoendolithus antarcticus TaxID=1507870 RepID=A0A1V8T4P9_9PEZI|nr:hypothetical protein B0A48_08809 [Cryoendolithus antarcticus]